MVVSDLKNEKFKGWKMSERIILERVVGVLSEGMMWAEIIDEPTEKKHKGVKTLCFFFFMSEFHVFYFKKYTYSCIDHFPLFMLRKSFLVLFSSFHKLQLML